MNNKITKHPNCDDKVDEITSETTQPVQSEQHNEDPETLKTERRQRTCWQRFCAPFNQCCGNMKDCLDFWCCLNECYDFCCRSNDVDDEGGDREVVYKRDTEAFYDLAAVAALSVSRNSRDNEGYTQGDVILSESELHSDSGDIGHPGDQLEGGDRAAEGISGGVDCRGGDSSNGDVIMSQGNTLIGDVGLSEGKLHSDFDDSRHGLDHKGRHGGDQSGGDHGGGGNCGGDGSDAIMSSYNSQAKGKNTYSCDVGFSESKPLGHDRRGSHHEAGHASHHGGNHSGGDHHGHGGGQSGGDGHGGNHSGGDHYGGGDYGGGDSGGGDCGGGYSGSGDCGGD